jgi:hypothetical protein
VRSCHALEVVFASEAHAYSGTEIDARAFALVCRDGRRFLMDIAGRWMRTLDKYIQGEP